MSAVQYSCADNTGYILFDRPKANAYDLEFHQEFREAIAQANADDNARVVVIRSALEKFFCAGADIKAFQENDTAANMQLVDQARENLASIESSSKIFIVEIRGHALGGGLEIALACDFRLGAEGEYKLGLPEVKLGLTPGNGGSQRLARLVGPNRALDLCVTGRNISPQDAYELGLFNRLLPADTFAEEAKQFATELASGASMAIGALKKGLRAGTHLSLADGLKIESDLVDTLYDTHDAQEGFTAFVEKRAPVYRGC